MSYDSSGLIDVDPPPRTSSRIAASRPSSVSGNIRSPISCFITPIDGVWSQWRCGVGFSQATLFQCWATRSTQHPPSVRPAPEAKGRFFRDARRSLIAARLARGCF